MRTTVAIMETDETVTQGKPKGVSALIFFIRYPALRPLPS
jgi:hypothetical protein